MSILNPDGKLQRHLEGNYLMSSKNGLCFYCEVLLQAEAKWRATVCTVGHKLRFSSCCKSRERPHSLLTNGRYFAAVVLQLLSLEVVQLAKDSA